MRCLQSPVACRSMNMKVHQTLVWLNLLSFGTKDLAAPTIGIQSAANHFHKKCSPTQSPIACRSMNMKVHQTLVWLNLLSFGTKELAAPTIGIQSAANHYTFHKKFTNNTLLRHFVSNTPACPLGGFNVSNLMGITRRMIDIGKKITFYFLQNV